MERRGARRRAARVVVLDPMDRVLLINARDPFGRDRRSWWEIPGGGIDHGEDTEDAVRRELWEEAGIRDAEIGPCVWTQTVRFTFAGLRFDQDEWVHVARCDGATDRPGGLEALEALAFGEQRWWPLEELLSARPRTIPYRMAEFLPALVHEPWPDQPVDITPLDHHVAAWNDHDGGATHTLH
jgi:8-oxo-dGTP pyrophosphatase MutT (NUDIX family)